MNGAGGWTCRLTRMTSKGSWDNCPWYVLPLAKSKGNNKIKFASSYLLSLA